MLFHKFTKTEQKATNVFSGKGVFMCQYILGFGSLQVLRFQHLCSINLLLVYTVQCCWQTEIKLRHIHGVRFIRGLG